MTEDFAAIPTHVTAVARTEQRSPYVRRVTLRGGLEGLRSVGPDSFVYFLLPPPGRTQLTVDAAFSWETHFATPEADRAVGAYYTIRAHRPDLDEIDVDMVLHGDGGAASAWAARATEHDPVALWGPRTAFDPPPDAEWFLLVADDTGVPALSAIAEWLPAGVTAWVVAEVADAAEQVDLACAAPMHERWLFRDGAEPGTTTHLIDAVTALRLPEGPGYVWGGGESHAMTAVRKVVRHRWGLPRGRVSLTPYWRHAQSPEFELDTD